MPAPAKPPPTVDDVANVLRGLINETMSRQDAANWASHWVTESHSNVEDTRVWEALKELVAADLITTDRPYLYGKEDFEAWLEELLASSPSESPSSK